MKSKIYSLVGAFFRVWQRHFDLPLRSNWKDFSVEYGSKWEAAAAVLTGWFAGTLIALLAVITTLVLNRFGGALVFAVLAYILLLRRDRGCGDGLISQMISAKLPCEHIPFNVIIPIVTVILKIFLLAVLFFYGDAWYLGMVIAGGLALEMSLAGKMQVSPPLIEFSGRAGKRFWAAVLAVLIVSFLLDRLATACGALVFALLWKYAGRLTENKGITVYGIRFYGALCIWLMLLAGVLTI